MALSEFDQPKLERLYSLLAPYWSAYEKHASIAYCAINVGDGTFVIAQAKLYLGATKPDLPKNKYRTSNLIAEHFAIDGAPQRIRERIHQLFDGYLETPDIRVEFPAHERGSHSLDVNEMAVVRRDFVSDSGT